MQRELGKSDRRTAEQIREQYEVEKELADRLRRASPAERKGLYAVVYDELFRRIPHHPQLSRKAASPRQTEQRLALQMGLLGRFLHPDATFLEIGAGDCSLSFAVAARVRQVYAVDVSLEITRSATRPPNFELFLSDGTSIPVPPDSVDVAYSNQLMEHLHPDDAREQLEEIVRALRPGGIYVCVTPNRLYGPRDISKYFDEVATGFHLREYTVTELGRLFAAAGFRRLRVFTTIRGLFYARVPIVLVRACEGLLARLPFALRRKLASRPPLRPLLGIMMAGVKGSASSPGRRA